MEPSDPLATSVPRSGVDVLNTPDPRRSGALTLLALAALGGIGTALALLLLLRPSAPQERLEAVPVPVPND
jgi:hypothetical protein